MKKIVFTMIFLLVTPGTGFCKTFKGYFITLDDKTIVANGFNTLKQKGKLFLHL